MRDEQEIPGASNRIQNAPSLKASRESGRVRRPTQKVVDSQWNETYATTTKPAQLSQRKRKTQLIPIYNDEPTPPPTQQASQSTQGLYQEGLDYASSQKKRRKTTKNSPQTREQWEDDFDSAASHQSKFQVLIEALGHEDFPQRMQIPQRPGKANFDEELDPLNPLWLWSKFVTPEVLQTIAAHTNEQETLLYEAQERHTQYERAWKDLTGDDIGAFLGAAMLMGVHPQPCVRDYWNCSEDKPISPLQKHMTRDRFQQICRYLKINSPHDKLNTSEYFMKVEPLLSTVRDACQKLILLPHTLSVDENLLGSRVRTVHLVQIDCKAAGKGYKIYTLACGSYLYNWMYTSKAAKVPQAKYYEPQSKGYEDDAFTDTERMVLTLVESMLKSQPQGFQFQVVFDNFFTTTRLFDELRSWGIGAFGTAKAGSGMPKPHILIDKVATKEKNYGEVVNTVVSQGRVNCITFIDNGAVWMMSTVYDTANEPPCWRAVSDRKNPSTHLARRTVSGDVEIPFPQISDNYNHQMNGSDLCQQSWGEYDISGHAHNRNWWPLLWHLISTSISNTLYLYRLKGIMDVELSHRELQERLGLQLLRSPAAVSRKTESTSVTSTKRPSLLRRPTAEHRWTRVPQRECVIGKTSDSSKLVSIKVEKLRALFEKYADAPLKLAARRNSPELESGRKHVRTTAWITLISACLTVPVLILAWAPLSPRPVVYGGVSLALASIVQVAIAGPFYPSALRALIFTHVIEMDLLIVLSTSTAYVFSLVSFAYQIAGRPLATGEFFETSTLLVTFIMLGRWVSAFARHEAVQSVSIRSLQAETAVLCDANGRGNEKTDARLLQYGDLFKVTLDSRITTDGVVILGATEVNESMVTGESLPVEKLRGSFVIAGSLNGSGMIVVRLTSLSGDNTVSTIAAMADEAKFSKPKTQELVDIIAGYFVPIVLILTILTFAAWIAIGICVRHQSGGHAVINAITYAISVLIVSCPCAVGLAVPMVVVISGGVAAKHGVVFKCAMAIENARKV